jgi:hypothetical protein
MSLSNQDHRCFFSARSFSRALSPIASVKSFFSLALSLSAEESSFFSRALSALSAVNRESSSLLLAEIRTLGGRETGIGAGAAVGAGLAVMMGACLVVDAKGFGRLWQAANPVVKLQNSKKIRTGRFMVVTPAHSRNISIRGNQFVN